MGLENCQILLDEPNATYFPGQTVTGKVNLNFNSPKKIKGIEVGFKGQAYVKWCETETYRSRSNGQSQTSPNYFIGKEKYFNIKYFVLGGPNSDLIELPAGNHVFALQYTLPNVLPSSFEEDLGHIRYTVKVTLVRPWKYDQTIMAAFTVINHLDTNSNPKWREPATLTMEKFFCCLCCTSGPLTVVLKLPCTGFVSGQIVPILLEIDNPSDMIVNEIKMKLKKVVSYHSHTPNKKTMKRDYVALDQKIGNTITENSSNLFNERLEIPALPPSNFDNCSIIDLHYLISVEIDFYEKLCGTLPITIGTIPLTNMVPMPVSYISVNAPPQPLVGWIPAPLNTPQDDPALLPPPSYDESLFSSTKDTLEEDESEHMLHNADWAPSYPIYNFNLIQKAPNTMPGFSGAPPSAPPEKQ